MIFGPLVTDSSDVNIVGKSVVKKEGRKTGVVASGLYGGVSVTVGVFVKRGTIVLT